MEPINVNIQGTSFRYTCKGPPTMINTLRATLKINNSDYYLPESPLQVSFGSNLCPAHIILSSTMPSGKFLLPK